MIRDVLKMGDARLLQPSQPVAIEQLGSPAMQALLEDMLDTMRERRGVGLAAPQIGVPLRVVILGCEQNPRYPHAQPIPLTTLINPELTVLSDEEEEAWEGCLSVPGMRGWVPRARHLRYRAIDPQGQIIDRTVEGFHARVVQHECDHLDGILYPMRVRDMRRFGFVEALFPPDTPADQIPDED